MLEPQLHLINSVVILLAAAVPIFFTLKLRSNALRCMRYIAGFFGFDLLSDGVFEPVSAVVFFGMF
jgi:hypothetical protein